MPDGPETFDVVVIGAGPGGYVCAVRCAQLGMRTALVEKGKRLGGSCLNVGCIPSKAWLESSERYHSLLHRFADHGIKAKGVSLDFGAMRRRVEAVVADTAAGVDFLMKKNKVRVLRGTGSFLDDRTVLVKGDGGERTVEGRHIVIATGSRPAALPGARPDGKRVITSDEALFLPRLPKSLAVIGGGAIGCELASVFNRLGTRTAVVEYAGSLVAGMDPDAGRLLERVFKSEGMEVRTGRAVEGVEAGKGGVAVRSRAAGGGGGEDVVEAELCLVAVGREPNTEGLDLEKAGLAAGDGGRIPTDGSRRTARPHVFAIGDATDGPMLAHKAHDEGVFVAEVIDGQKPRLDPGLVPGVVYTQPEIAGVGALAADLERRGVPFRTGTFPLKASGRARAGGESHGFAKVLAHRDTDEILGVHVAGPRAADMIAEAVVAMGFRASAEDVARCCHPHPTYTEALREACLAACGAGAIHS